jgi:hypothetical protein
VSGRQSKKPRLRQIINKRQGQGQRKGQRQGQGQRQAEKHVHLRRHNERKKERKNGINSKVREGKIRKFLKIKRR